MIPPKPSATVGLGVQTMVEQKNDKQKLVDICFQLVLVATSNEAFCKKTNP